MSAERIMTDLLKLGNDCGTRTKGDLKQKLDRNIQTTWHKL